jgi:hypothetical protein
MNDDFLFVGKRQQHYLIVRRRAGDRRPDMIQSDEIILSSVTNASSAVAEAGRLNRELAPGHGVVIARKVRRELGW